MKHYEVKIGKAYKDDKGVWVAVVGDHTIVGHSDNEQMLNNYAVEGVVKYIKEQMQNEPYTVNVVFADYDATRKAEELLNG